MLKNRYTILIRARDDVLCFLLELWALARFCHEPGSRKFILLPIGLRILAIYQTHRIGCCWALTHRRIQFCENEYLGKSETRIDASRGTKFHRKLLMIQEADTISPHYMVWRLGLINGIDSGSLKHKHVYLMLCREVICSTNSIECGQQGNITHKRYITCRIQ